MTLCNNVSALSMSKNKPCNTPHMMSFKNTLILVWF